MTTWENVDVDFDVKEESNLAMMATNYEDLITAMKDLLSYFDSKSRFQICLI